LLAVVAAAPLRLLAAPVGSSLLILPEAGKNALIAGRIFERRNALHDQTSSLF
jgi:hypothetical protein